MSSAARPALLHGLAGDHVGAVHLGEDGGGQKGAAREGGEDAQRGELTADAPGGSAAGGKAHGGSRSKTTLR